MSRPDTPPWLATTSVFQRALKLIPCKVPCKWNQGNKAAPCEELNIAVWNLSYPSYLEIRGNYWKDHVLRCGVCSQASCPLRSRQFWHGLLAGVSHLVGVEDKFRTPEPSTFILGRYAKISYNFALRPTKIHATYRVDSNIQKHLMSRQRARPSY